MSSRRILFASCLCIAALTANIAWAQPPEPKDGPLGMKFVPLPKATFYMGGGGGNAGKKTEIKVDFEIAIHTVTQGQWQVIMGNNPSWFSRNGTGKKKVKDVTDAELKHFPVEMVSWDDTQAFLKKLNEEQRGKGWVYRLPTEAEWEYACRGGAVSPKQCSFDFYLTKPTNDLSSTQANFNGDFPAGNGEKGPNLERPAKVGSYPSNHLGLHDMHGNVQQWCQGFYSEQQGNARVARGGAWKFKGMDGQTALRYMYRPDFGFDRVGFRLARVPADPEAIIRAMKFVKVPKGKFWMGWDHFKKQSQQAEIKEDFEMGAFTVTQGEWQALMGHNPSWFARNGEGQRTVKDIADTDLVRFPVENVSWYDVREFLKILNEHEKGRGWLYRLPTEAEWEYACRNALTSKEDCSFDFYFDKPTNDLSSLQANFSGRPAGKANKGPYLGRPTMVGSYLPNKLGLYDMHGNVRQFCAAIKVGGVEKIIEMPIRGGYWGVGGDECHAASRGSEQGIPLLAAPGDNSVGFRLVRTAVGQQPGKPAPEPPKAKDGPLGMKFVPLPKATFYMGGGGGKVGKKTEIKEDFEIAIHTVTQGQWQVLMGKNPSYFSRDGKYKDKVKDFSDEDLKQFPVEWVSWDDAQEYITKLNAKEAGAGYQYRLPTEAEWEYACRGGATSEEECSFHFCFAKPTNDLCSEQANVDGNFPFGNAPKGPSLGRPTKVGSYSPNKLGLHDMHGNVLQWCADLAYPERPNRSSRVSRGGCWNGRGEIGRAGWSHGTAFDPRFASVGFRLVRVPVTLALAPGAAPADDKPSPGLIIPRNRMQHFSSVMSVAWSPDGKMLASGGWQGEVKLWDVATGKELASLSGFGAYPEALGAWSPDGKTLATLASGEVKLWDVATRKARAITLEGPSFVAWTRAGKALAAGARKGAFKVWDVSAGHVVATLKAETDKSRALALSPDGKMLAVWAGKDYVVRVWDLASGKERAVFMGQRRRVLSAAFSPDGKHLATGDDYDYTIKLWDLATGKEQATLQAHAEVQSVTYSPDGKTLAAGSRDSLITLWDAATGKERATLKGHQKGVNAVGWSPDGKTLASGGDGGSIRLWDVATAREQATLEGRGPIAWSPNGKTLASGSSKVIMLWDLATRKERAALKGHTGRIRALTYSPDGKTLASGSEDATIKLWDAATGMELATLKTNPVRSLAFSQDGKTLASGSTDKTIILWDTDTRKQKAMIRTHAAPVRCVAFSPDGKTLASGSGDFGGPVAADPAGELKLSDVATGKDLTTRKLRDGVASVAWSPDGKTLAYGTKEVWLRDVESKREKVLDYVRLDGELRHAVVFGPDGKTLASLSGCIRLWDVASGKRLDLLWYHDRIEGEAAAAWSPDGKTLAVAMQYGRVMLFDVSPAVKNKE